VAALAAVAAVLVGVVGADPDPEPAPTSSVPFVSLRDAGSTSYRTSFSPYRFAYYDWERHAPHWSLTPDDRYVYCLGFSRFFNVYTLNPISKCKKLKFLFEMIVVESGHVVGSFSGSGKVSDEIK